MEDRVPAGQGRHLWFAGNLMTIKAGTGGRPGPTVLEARLHAGHAPPLHVHHDEDEAFYLLAGTMRFRAGDEESDLGAGDFLLVPRGRRTRSRSAPRARGRSSWQPRVRSRASSRRRESRRSSRSCRRPPRSTASGWRRSPNAGT
ncbi:MAG: cupin domain-containing protein [Actinobacteria bacterium]|nr:cupin domain-containing protein [Actinomycetota bacterium]